MHIITFTIPSWSSIASLLDQLEVKYSPHKLNTCSLQVIKGGFLEDFLHEFEFMNKNKYGGLDGSCQLGALIELLEDSKPRLDGIDALSYESLIRFITHWDDVPYVGLGLTFKWHSRIYDIGLDASFEHPWLITAGESPDH